MPFFLTNNSANRSSSPNATLNIPVRPARPNLVDPDLVPQTILPVIVSPLANQLLKKKKYRKRWASRSKSANIGNLNASLPFNQMLTNHKAFNLLRKADNISNCGKTDLGTSDRENYSFVDHLNLSPHFFAFSTHKIDTSSFATSKPTDCLYTGDEQESDIEDLTTPTLKSSETFDDDTSITPSQTHRTPACNKAESKVPLTPRIIFEDFQRQFNHEDLMIRSKDLKALNIPGDDVVQRSDPSTCASLGPIPPMRQAAYDTNAESNEIGHDSGEERQKLALCNSGHELGMTGLANAALSDASPVDPADESFESFGDDQILSSNLSDGVNAPRQGKLRLVDIFPLPPVTRSPARDAQSMASSKSNFEKICRITMEGSASPPTGNIENKSEAGKVRPTPLVFGGLLPGEGSKVILKLNPVRPSSEATQESHSFQHRPSSYRHVASESKDDKGPDHLEAATRMMRMFEIYLENSPKTNGQNTPPISSISNKPSRKFKLQDSPLKKFGDFRIPETPKQVSQAEHSHFQGNPLAKSSHWTPPNAGHVTRSSGLVSQTSVDEMIQTNESSLQGRSTSFDYSYLKADDVSLSPDDSEPGSILEKLYNPVSSVEEYTSPLSDSDTGPFQSPRTPFGYLDHLSNPFEPCVPKLKHPSFIQHLSFGSHQPASSATEPSEIDSPIHSRASVHSDPRNRESPSTCSFPGPPLKQMRSISKISNMADELLSRITSQKFSKDNVDYRKSESTSVQEISIDCEGNSDILDISSSSGQISRWPIIIQGDLCHSQFFSPLNFALTTSRDHSIIKPVLGRNLLEQPNDDQKLGDIDILHRKSLLESKKNNSRDFSSKPMEIEGLAPRWQRKEASNNQISLSLTMKGKNQSLVSDSSIKRDVNSFKLADESIVSQENFNFSIGLSVNKSEMDEDIQHGMSPIRLYGKQQGILETGQWKKNNLNFQSMKSQYESQRSKKSVKKGPAFLNHANGEGSQNSTMRGSVHCGSEISLMKGEILTEEEEMEEKESLIVYKIQEEDENQIMDFEMNRLKKIFFNKSLKASRSKAKLSSKSSMKFPKISGL